MRRRQLIEIEDQPWCPAAVRDGLTDYLQFITDRTEPYAPAARLLTEALRVSPDDRSSPPAVPVIDLGSGGGGPWRRLVRRLQDAGVPVRVRLTDLHPNVAAFDRIAHETDGTVSGEPRAVPADAVPEDLTGFRTIFTAFHHFPPAMARRVLGDAVARGQGIAVFESTTRDLLCLSVMLLVPLAVSLTTLFIRPFRLSRLLLTYLVPVIPTVAFIDGVVSCLRTYTPDELRGLAESVDGATGYVWTAGHAGGGPIPMTYLVGVPVRREATAPERQSALARRCGGAQHSRTNESCGRPLRHAHREPSRYSVTSLLCGRTLAIAGSLLIVGFASREHPSHADAQARAPKSLFNGKDLKGWHVDVPALDSNPRARNPFIVRNGMLVSLGEPQGHIITDSSYRNYRLEVEYRFPGKPGNSGVLVHASTPRALYKMFPKSIEVQMESGNAGDFWCILEDIRVPDMERRRGPRATWGTTEGKARRIVNLTDNSEKPVGQWNTMVIDAVGRSIKVWVNGDLVNDGSDATADHGQIALQSEGSEVEFRKVSLTQK